jgi:hypothetical protein
MKILYLAREDCANTGYRYARAVSALEGYETFSVSYVDNYIKYPKHIFSPKPERLMELIDAADVVHVFDEWMRFRGQTDGKPLVVTYNGTAYRANPGVFDAADEERGVRARLCTTIDMMRHGLQWIPLPIPGPYPLKWTRDVTKRSQFTVSHAPTNREGKGTRLIIDALKDMPGVNLDIIERVPNELCMERKARSHLYVDQFMAGYGVNALEAWSLGLPVIADTEWGDDIYELMVEAIGTPPFYKCASAELAGAVGVFREDARMCRDYGRRGMQYLENYHDPFVVARQLSHIYDRAAHGKS